MTTGGDTQFGITKRGKSRGFAFAMICLAALAAGCSKSDKEADSGVFDTSRLPRVTGAKEVFASPASTIFTSPDSVAKTADTVDKALAAAGWQKYIAPHTAYSQDEKQRQMSLKKGSQVLSVFITVAPAQNNATSVQYGALALKNDLPFAKDATDIEFDPNRPLLTLVTAEPIDKTLDFYRKELSDRGWALWSQKLNGNQPAGGTSGELTKSGAYAYYVQGDRRLAALQLERAEGGRIKLKFEGLPSGMLESMQRSFFNSDNTGAAQADVRQVPRLDGAKEDAAHASSDRVSYSVVDSLANTVAAIKKMLGADGWKPYVAPLDDVHSTLLAFKKGRQGLSVSFYIQVGKNEQTSEVTTVEYSPTRLIFALALPDDATDIVFDANRPYLNANTAGTVDGTLDFYRKELAAMGWSPLSAADATAHWPDAKVDEKPASGVHAYFIRGTQRPILLSLQPRDGGKVNVEIKVPTFALPQTLEIGQEDFGLPTPKISRSSGGTGGSTQHTIYAHVPAEVGTVLAFYRREFAARNWKEETQGTVITPDAVTLNYTSPEGPGVLKLSHKYDLTIVNLVQQITPKPAAKVETPPNAADAVDDAMKQMQQMMRDAGLPQQNAPQAAPAPAPKAPEAALRKFAGNKAPVPMPDTAEDIEFDGADGKLEFNSASGVKAVADFYRAAMKEQRWDSGSSVINNANMVVLNFAKAGKAVSFTIMRMGNKTNVSADGPALKAASAESDRPAGTAEAAKVSPPASADDLVAEESGGLPVPKRHTMSDGTKTTFRRDLKASVPLNLSDVLAFYRRELGKLNWKEESSGAVVTADNVLIMYTTADGPAVLKLGRKDGETSVSLVVKNPNEASKAGVLPKPGQVKILFGNINEAEAAITFNNKSIKVAAGAGTKAPDGPILDVPPGKYKYSIKLPGKPLHNDEVVLGADEIWGLMIGPGGVLPLQVY
ncbi:MAG TPA: hypothetical protein VFC45_02835 [Pseudolabrys sp.]|nr:hypothetical protein [Pseudolabrys sp.]